MLNCQLLPGLNCGGEPCYSTPLPLLVNIWEGVDSERNHAGWKCHQWEGRISAVTALGRFGDAEGTFAAALLFTVPVEGL